MQQLLDVSNSNFISIQCHLGGPISHLHYLFPTYSGDQTRGSSDDRCYLAIGLNPIETILTYGDIHQLMITRFAVFDPRVHYLT